MNRILNLCVFIIVIEQIVCRDVVISKLFIKGGPNEYLGKITYEVKNNVSITATVPVRKKLDENIQVTANLTFLGASFLPDAVSTVCDAFDESGYFKPIVDNIKSADARNLTFPRKCPVPIGVWKISDYVIDMEDYIPKSMFNFIPSGDFHASISVGLPKTKPIANIRLAGYIAEPEEYKSIFSFFDY